ncbi:MAG: hypothetical protein CV082_07825 [Candidatus Brocadia sp. BL1]|nr:MAG: hypothetical protein CV082_07825 [Candidatus Brocadia sp. BL1]
MKVTVKGKNVHCGKTSSLAITVTRITRGIACRKIRVASGNKLPVRCKANKHRTCTTLLFFLFGRTSIIGCLISQKIIAYSGLFNILERMLHFHNQHYKR